MRISFVDFVPFVFKKVFSAHFKLNRHFVAFFETFCFADTRFDGDNVEVIFRKQGRGPFGLADPHMDRYHPPAIRHDFGDRFYLATLLRRDRDEEPRCGASPEKYYTGKVDVHWGSISNARYSRAIYLCWQNDKAATTLFSKVDCRFIASDHLLLVLLLTFRVALTFFVVTVGDRFS